MTSRIEQNDPTTIEEARLEKLKIELRALKAKSRWAEGLLAMIPIITTLVAVAGLITGQYMAWLQQRAHENEINVQQRAHEREIADQQRAHEKEIADQQRAHEKELLEQAERDFRRPFWQKQVDLYFAASEAVSRMATSTSAPERKKAEDDYKALFYGQLVIVEDAGVSDAMVSIRTYFAQCGSASAKSDQAKCSDSRLLNLSLSLASACRESIGKDWKGQLDSLKGLYHN